MIERQVLRVVYSPFKAFEDIVKNPDVKGPLLLLALGVITASIAGYVSSSKVYVQESEQGQYVPLVSTSSFGGHMFYNVIDTAMRLSIVWFIHTGIMLLVTKVSGLSGISWRVLFLVIGYTIMTSVVYALISALLISALPTVYLEWGVWNPPAGTEQTAYDKRLVAYGAWFSSPLYQTAFYLSFVVEGWTAALAAIGIHALFSVTWKKAIAISATASILTYLLTRIILSL